MKKKATLTLRCEYTDAELAFKRDELSTVIVRQSEVELRKAEVNRDFKEELDGLYSRASELAHQIKARGESRSVACLVEFHKPNVGEKTIIRLDTGELVRVEVMTEDERQEEFGFDVEARDQIKELIDSATTELPTPPPSDEPPPDLESSGD
jgi:hypothetical protein